MFAVNEVDEELQPSRKIEETASGEAVSIEDEHLAPREPPEGPRSSTKRIAPSDMFEPKPCAALQQPRPQSVPDSSRPQYAPLPQQYAPTCAGRACALPAAAAATGSLRAHSAAGLCIPSRLHTSSRPLLPPQPGIRQQPYPQQLYPQQLVPQKPTAAAPSAAAASGSLIPNRRRWRPSSTTGPSGGGENSRNPWPRSRRSGEEPPTTRRALTQGRPGEGRSSPEAAVQDETGGRQPAVRRHPILRLHGGAPRNSDATPRPRRRSRGTAAEGDGSKTSRAVTRAPGADPQRGARLHGGSGGSAAAGEGAAGVPQGAAACRA